jgi:asparagine synthase (glutamine-hydrolysing)
MCGIAGKLLFDASRLVPRGLLTRMADSVAHRGPDASGIYLNGNIGLAHRRLSIIDLATGDQPLGNEDGTVQVVFNGEIYNFADVRRELESHGHRFRTKSDTEVIVHGFEQWGQDCVSHFRGMFAFAAWDQRRRVLLLARDRLGVKPLYYAPLHDGIVFGSEIKSLLEDPAVSREWDPEALDAYLTLGYVAAPQTIYRAVRKLDAGETLVVDGNRLQRRRYWDLHFTGDGDDRREEEYLEGVGALLDEAVRLRLISDVPLGAFLSGGIDSSAVVAAMVRMSDAPVLTMSVGFDSKEYDELDHALTVARHLQCEAHTRVITPQVEELLPKVAWHMDEPFADSSAVPTFYVSRAAREKVTVALSGDGGDEVWAGYSRHGIEGTEVRVRNWLGPAAHAAAMLGRALPATVKGSRSLRHLDYPAPLAYALKHAYDYFDDGLRHRCYTGDFATAVRGSDPYAKHRQLYEACESADPIDRAMYVDVRTYMVDDVLTKVDRMSMAVSLETREPLLDHKLLEYAATVPSSLKLRHGTTKYLLRRLLQRRLPPSILERPKQGFAAPIGKWLAGPLRALGEDVLFGGRLAGRGIFHEGELRRLWDDHSTGRGEHRHRLWAVIMLELWFRQFIDGGVRASDAAPIRIEPFADAAPSATPPAILEAPGVDVVGSGRV